jgi:hypothetical protein
VTNREFCLARRQAESPAFLRVLKAVPEGSDYRPDPKARTAVEIAWLLAEEEAALAQLIANGSVHWKPTPPHGSVADIASAWERTAADVNQRIAALGDDAWDGTGRFTMDGMDTPWEDTIGQFAWGFLFDAIHHRGQLSTYLRPMGGKVPSIYGPSADDPGGA